MRKEIEVKAKVSNLNELKEKLTSLGIFLSEPIVQNDETFVASDYGAYNQFQPNKNVLRITESIFLLSNNPKAMSWIASSEKL